MKKEVLGVRIDDVSLEEAVNYRGLIFTPNPEFLVEANKNPEFKKLLNSSDLNIPDGFGLQLVAGIKNRVPGVDLMLRLCSEAAKNGWTVGLVGGYNDVALLARKKLEELYPGIKIVFATTTQEADELLKNPKLPKPVDLLFVAYGMVKQEKFLASEGLTFRTGVGVGGSFNEIAGLEKPAPEFMKDLGLKWLWRLICEPKRFKRIINAVIIFPWLVFKYGKF